jgi:hypothetical protein
MMQFPLKWISLCDFLAVFVTKQTFLLFWNGGYAWTTVRRVHSRREARLLRDCREGDVNPASSCVLVSVSATRRVNERWRFDNRPLRDGTSPIPQWRDNQGRALSPERSVRSQGARR